jgi:hypothetical protein
VSWQLDSVADTLEDSTNEAGRRVLRERRTITLWRVWEWATFPSEVGDTKGSITWYVGGASFTKVLASGKKYLCTLDELTQVTPQTGKSVRRQVWTYVSEYEATEEFGA